MHKNTTFRIVLFTTIFVFLGCQSDQVVENIIPGKDATGLDVSSLDASRLDAADAAKNRDAENKGDLPVLDTGRDLNDAQASDLSDMATGQPCSRPQPADWRYTTGTPVFGANDFIEYIPGDLPIVLTAPHGGALEPQELIQDTSSLASDARSQETARGVVEAFRLRTGHSPHLIINHVRRDRLNMNRSDATPNETIPSAIQAWDDFHGFVDDAKRWVTTTCGSGHYFDMHTNGGDPRWTEIGLALSRTNLTLRGDAFEALADNSTYKALAERSSLSFDALVRGPTSIGGLLETRGMLVVPSPNNVDTMGEAIFDGGYNVRRHGSRDGGTIDGTQVEIHFQYINAGSTKRLAFIEDFTTVVQLFMREHYGFDLGGAP